MRERLDAVKKFLGQEEKLERLDLILYLLIALFSGVIIGFLTSPKGRPPKYKYIGCFNGSFNGNSADGAECEEEADICEDEPDCEDSEEEADCRDASCGEDCGEETV